MRKENFNKCVNYQFVSITVQNETSKYFFPDLPNLRGDVYIQRIHVYMAPTLSADVNKVNNISGLGGGALGTLTLNKGSDEIFKDLDLNLLNPFQGDNVIYNTQGSLYLDNIIIDFSKSFVQILASATTPPFSICFGIFYIKKSDLPLLNQN
jgi:hypothetical protein